MVIVAVLAILFAWPQIVLNGQVTVATHVPHVLGTDCNIVRHLPPVYSLVYHGLMYGLFVICFAAYAVLYGRIFYVLWRKGWFAPSPPAGSRQCKQEVAQTPASRPPLSHREEAKRNRVRISHRDSAESPSKIKRRSEQKAEENESADKKSVELSDKNAMELDVNFADTVYRLKPICIKIVQPSGGSSQVEGDLGLAGAGVTMDSSSGFHEIDQSTDEEGSSCSEADFRDNLSHSSVHETSEEPSCQLCPEETTADSNIPDGHSCRLVMQSRLLSDGTVTENLCFSVPPASLKEKHPRAIHRCQQVQHEKKRNIGRSQSEPCGDLADARASRPFLRHCCTCDDIIKNWNKADTGLEVKLYGAMLPQHSHLERGTLFESEERLRRNGGKVCTCEAEDRGNFPAGGKTHEQRAAFKQLTFGQRVAMFDGRGFYTAALEKDCADFLPERPKGDRRGCCEIHTPYVRSGSFCAASATEHVGFCTRHHIHHVHGPEHAHNRDTLRFCRPGESELGDGESRNEVVGEVSLCTAGERFTHASQFKGSANVSRSSRRDVEADVTNTAQDATRQPTVPDHEISRTSLVGFTPSESSDGAQGVLQPTDQDALHISRADHCGPKDRTKPSGVEEDDTKADQTSLLDTADPCEHSALDATRTGSLDTIRSCRESTVETTESDLLDVTKSREHSTTGITHNAPLPDLTKSFEHSTTDITHTSSTVDITKSFEHSTTDMTCNALLDITNSCEDSVTNMVGHVSPDVTKSREKSTTDVTPNAPPDVTKSGEGSSTAGTEPSPKSSLPIPKPSLHGTAAAAAAADDPAPDTRCKGHIRRHGGKRLRIGKTTLMMAMVTLSAVLGFVPFLTVIVMKTSGTKFKDNTASTGDLAYMFCIRSYLLNNVINPFVYFYVNPRFRQKVSRVLRCVCRVFLRLRRGGNSAESDISPPRPDT